MMLKTRCIGTLLLSALFLSAAAIAADMRPQVHYDSAADRLTVVAQEIPLSTLLAHIAIASGLEILMDPDADRPVSITLRDQPLEAGLKRLVRGLSYAMFYESKPFEGSKPNSPLLIAMKVLPQGKEDRTALAPVVTLEKEARARAVAPGSTPRPSGPSAGYSAKRWQMRLDKLPDATRQRLEEHVRQHQVLREKQVVKRAEQRAERQEALQKRRSAIGEKAQQIWGQRPESDQTRAEDVTRGNSW
jgi:hypothetical protein